MAAIAKSKSAEQVILAELNRKAIDKEIIIIAVNDKHFVANHTCTSTT